MRTKNIYHFFLIALMLQFGVSDPDNFITIAFGENVTYNEGFSNDFRKDISCIKIDGSENSTTEKLEITANSEVEIHFSKPIESLESFFDTFSDKNAEYIKSVNMSNFNASLVVSFAYMFYQCSLLEEFVPPQTKTPLLANIESMFEGCSNLVSINFTQFNFENVINMDALFYNCSSLVYVNMSYLDLLKVESAEFMLDGANSLKYLDFRDSKLADAILKNLFKDENIYTCLGQAKSDYKEICCKFDIENKECNYENYILINYGINNESYQFSSECEECFKDIGFLTVEDKIISKNEKFEVQTEIEVKIFFVNSVKNFSNFFSQNRDIIKINMDNFVKSELVDMEKTFANCTNLESVNLNNIKGNSLINMNNLFDSCSSLIYVEIFSDNFKNVVNCDDMFKDVKDLAVLDTKGSYLSENFKNQLPNYTLLNRIDKDKGETVLNNNYLPYDVLYDERAISHMKIKYRNKVVFGKNFALKYRDSISFMTVGFDNFVSKRGPFTVPAGAELRIYFFSTLSSLESFFSQWYNTHATNIVSIDCSAFNFKGISSVESFFYHCDSLKYVNLYGADLSGINNYEWMFAHCGNIVSLNFSKVKFGKSTNDLSYVMLNCASIKTCDFSGAFIQDYFPFPVHVGYLNLKNSSITEDVLNNFKWPISNASIICPPNNGDVPESLKEGEINCVDFDLEISNIKGENYVSLIYESNFNFSLDSLKANKDITSYIKMNNYRYKGDFTVQGRKKVEIHFSSPPNTLENYFSPSSEGNGLTGNLLISVDFSHFDFSSVTTTKGMFEGCINLESVDLSNAKFSTVTNMDNMFSGCTKLKSVNLSNIEGSSINSMKETFKNCFSLKILDIYKFNLGNVKTIENIFEGIDSLDYFKVDKASLSDYLKEKTKEVLKGNTIVFGTFENNYQDAAYNTKDCEYNFQKGKCELSNYYIKVYFKKVSNTESTLAFTLLSDCKQDIDLIYKDNKEYTKLDDSNSIKGITTSLEIYFKPTLTSLDNFFKGMTDIESVDLSHLEIFNLSSTANMFNGCTSLKYVNFTNFFPTNLNDISNMFNGCTSLESINISNLFQYNEAEIDMNSLFKGCISLKSVIFSKEATIIVNNMSNMFNGCSNIEIIDLSNFKMLQGIDLSSMFSQMTSLKYLDLSSLNLDENSTYDNMFEGVSSLKYLDLYGIKYYDYNLIKENFNIISKVDNLKVCQKEDIINKQNTEKNCCYFNTSSLECENLNFIILYYGKDVEYKNGFENEARKGISFIIHKYHELKINPEEKFDIKAGMKVLIYFSEAPTSFTGFFSSEFDENTKYITSIDLSQINLEHVDDLSYLFFGCYLLESVYLLNVNTFNATNMSSMFSGCVSLKSVDLQNLDTSNVIDMNKMFYRCYNLLNISLINFDISLVTDMSSTFALCTSLEEIDFPKANSKNLKKLAKTFYKCRKLKKINLTNFYTSAVDNMNHLFSQCNSLAWLYIPNFDMNSCENFENMFNEIRNIQYINLYNFKNDKMVGEYFNQSNNLTVCQSENIITNANAFNCCNYDFETKRCFDYYIPTTIIENTIINIETQHIENKTINIETQHIPIENTATKIINEATSINTPYLIKTTIPAVDNINISLILKGFSHFRHLSNRITFYIYFENENKLFNSKGLKFPVTYERSRVLRMLETYNAICELDENSYKNILIYFCQIYAQITNLKSLKIESLEEFQFFSSNDAISFKNIEIKYSPLGIFLANNIQYSKDEFNVLRDASIYILEHSLINKDEKHLNFNISGIISNQKPNFANVKINLLTFTNYKNETIQEYLNCSVIEIINNSYVLNCEGNKDCTYDLQNALSIINYELLMVNFDEGAINNVSFNQESESHRLNLSKRNGLSAGTIVTIVLAIAAACAIVIVTFVCIRKKSHYGKIEADSTIRKFK